MPRYDSVYPALKWRYQNFAAALGYQVLPQVLVKSLSVDELPYRHIPDNLWPSVRAFRKLRTEDRYRMARRFLQEIRDLKEAVKQAKKDSDTSAMADSELDLSTLREEVERVRTKALTDIDTDPLDLVARGNFQFALANLDQARIHLDLAILTQAKAVAKLQRGR